jgi:hypothetical protein
MRGLAVGVVAVAVIVVSLRWGSFVAGGSDSYCYVHQAERWAGVLAGLAERPFTGRRPGLQAAEPLALGAPWPNPALAFAPVGHTPSPTVPGAIVPICPAGLSMAMAPFVALAGPGAAFLVLPFFGALLIAATYAVGARFGARVGVAAAVLTACSPPFLYQVVQPMSDVPAAALWLAAVAAATGTKPRHVVMSGVATSAAILMRPNLLPLGITIGVFLLLRPERTWRQRAQAALIYALCCAPGCAAVGAIQQAFFGSPLASGYGSLGALFAVEHIVPNLRRYAVWLWQTHTPVIALAALAPWLLPGALTTLLAGLFAVNLALYLPYVVFEDWSFLRFLLPTIPLLVILTVATIDASWRRAGLPHATPAVAIVAALLGVVLVREADDRNAFNLQRMEARFERTGRFVAERLPANALVITGWQSGSVRFYAGRKTLAWHGLDPAWLDRAIVYVRSRGFEPYLLFERWEEPLFRQHFLGEGLGALDWPPMAEVAAQVRIYRPGDRARYQAGNATPTEYFR